MKFRTGILLVIGFMVVSGAYAAHAPGGDKKKKTKKGDTQQTATLSKQQVSKLERLQMDAEKAKVTEDIDAAVKSYQDILVIDPANANAHFQLAQIYADKGKFADAETEAAAAVKYDSGIKWYQELLGNIYLNEGKVKEAVEAFKTLIDKFPNNPDYYLNLGFLYSKLGQFDNAIKVYDQFEKNFGIDEQVITEKRNLYLRLGKFNEAVGEVQKLEEAFPGESEYMLMEAELYRAKKQNDKAAAIYQKILAAEPDNPKAQLAIAQMNAQVDDGTQKKESLKEIFKNPKVGIDTKISILLISYIQMNSEDSSKRKEAIELADILVNVHPNEAKAFAVQGDLFFLDNQLDKALNAYKQSLSISKDIFQVWQQVMGIYNEKADWENLLSTANEAMELFPNQAVVYLYKGGAEVQLKQFDKAVKSFSKGEKVSADNVKLKAQFLSNLGDVYHSLNQYAASDSAYEKALKIDPENAYVLNNYSYYLSIRKENLEKAKQMSAYANKLEPQSSSFLDTYAWILFQMNDFAGAKEWQEKAMQADGGQSGTILEHYGDILSKLGKKEEALKYWKQAKNLGTDSSTLERKIAEQKYVE
jgi:tetratricopeptide (TPR) repeat protein